MTNNKQKGFPYREHRSLSFSIFIAAILSLRGSISVFGVLVVSLIIVALIYQDYLVRRHLRNSATL